jgi:hypothetical protein
VSYLVMGLRGRLGNNLWEFASGLGMARAIGAELLFDAHRVPAQVQFLPELLGSHYREATAAELRRVGVASTRDGTAPTVARFALRHTHALARRVRGKGPGQLVRRELTGLYRPELFALDPPVYVSGFFQDETFFRDLGDEVAAWMQGWPDDGASLADLGTTVAVSFRRGDYNLFEAGLPLEYYDRAMRMVAEEVDAPTFVLFGDDPAFVEMFAERAQQRGHAVVSALPRGEHPLTQLRLLGECDHAILANSTFAWWGAWLGDRRAEARRIVLAPPGWFGVNLRAGWREVDVRGVAPGHTLEAIGRAATYSEPS